MAAKQTVAKRARKKKRVRRASVPKDRYISRVPGAFLVFLRNSTKGTSKMFSDSKYGTKVNALRAARAYRDEVYGAPPPRYIKRKAQRNSQTKVLGVCLVELQRVYEGKKKRSIYKIPMAIGTYVDIKGKVQNKQFSVNRLGQAEAMEQAHTFRKTGLALVKEQRKLVENNNRLMATRVRRRPATRTTPAAVVAKGAAA